QGVSTDILEASAQAYVRALANLVAEVEAALESSPDREGSSTKGPCPRGGPWRWLASVIADVRVL
ncbi:MAG: hypothetical protein ACO307_18215, partial [Ilumatobacteraceae bacterium]